MRDISIGCINYDFLKLKLTQIHYIYHILFIRQFMYNLVMLINITSLYFQVRYDYYEFLMHDIL